MHVSFEGVVTETVYDDSLGAGGRMTETRFFDNLTQYDDSGGTPSERRVYLYDTFGREVQVTHHRSGGSADVWKTEYDADGRVIRLESPQGAVGLAILTGAVWVRWVICNPSFSFPVPLMEDH